ncbi:MAG: hypothetical protein RIT27_29 [Pseudomonadota bacterium]|jgi:RNA polymerase sigma-70 factor (ECF subfamily)
MSIRVNNQGEITDETLMYRVQKGDQLAFQYLVKKYVSALHGFARRILNNSHEAEDIVQETFLRAWRHAEQWQSGRAKLSTWLHSITYHLCIDNHRKNKLITTPLDETLENEDTLEIPAAPDNLLKEELSQQVEKALQTLPERQRTAIALCYYQGISNLEAAEILNVSVAALESLLARGRKNLKVQLQKYISGEL